MEDEAWVGSLRAALFDFGGTLDGDGVHWCTRFREAYLRAGVALPRLRFERVFSAADQRIAARAANQEAGLRELLAAQVSEQLELLGIRDAALGHAVLAEVLASARAALARSREILAALRPRLRLGVVSNFTGALESVCREAGLSPLLSVFVDSSLVGVSKPDPEIFRLAANRLGLAPQSCLFVGDSLERDIVPAKAIGMRAVWLRGPEPRPCSAPGLPDAVVTSLRELPALLGIRV